MTRLVSCPTLLSLSVFMYSTPVVGGVICAEGWLKCNLGTFELRIRRGRCETDSAGTTLD
jgi:hypothetical protein